MLPMTTVQSPTEPAHISPLLAGRWNPSSGQVPRLGIPAEDVKPLHRSLPRSSGSLSPAIGDDRPRFLGLG